MASRSVGSALETRIVAGECGDDLTFSQRVWALTSRIPCGKVATYGEVARALGTRAGRAVGMALHVNPYAPRVPCHRVVGSDGKLVGFAHGLAKKKKLLVEEGIPFIGDKIDLDRCGYRF